MTEQNEITATTPEVNTTTDTNLDAQLAEANSPNHGLLVRALSGAVLGITAYELGRREAKEEKARKKADKKAQREANKGRGLFGFGRKSDDTEAPEKESKDLNLDSLTDEELNELYRAVVKQHKKNALKAEMEEKMKALDESEEKES